MNFPLDVIEHILTYGSSYYKENYKNRGGAFYKQIEKWQKTAISNVYVPIEKRKIKNRYTSEFAYLYERRLSDKYILYVRDNRGMDWIDDEDENVRKWFLQDRTTLNIG